MNMYVRAIILHWFSVAYMYIYVYVYRVLPPKTCDIYTLTTRDVYTFVHLPYICMQWPILLSSVLTVSVCVDAAIVGKGSVFPYGKPGLAWQWVLCAGINWELSCYDLNLMLCFCYSSTHTLPYAPVLLLGQTDSCLHTHTHTLLYSVHAIQACWCIYIHIYTRPRLHSMLLTCSLVFSQVPNSLTRLAPPN